MIGFDTGNEGEMGNDEVHICTHCMEYLIAGFIDTNILAGHFSYGMQTKTMVSVKQYDAWINDTETTTISMRNLKNHMW